MGWGCRIGYAGGGGGLGWEGMEREGMEREGRSVGCATLPWAFEGVQLCCSRLGEVCGRWSRDTGAVLAIMQEDVLVFLHVFASEAVAWRTGRQIWGAT